MAIERDLNATRREMLKAGGAVLALGPLQTATAATTDYYLYVGNYTGPNSKGIQAFRYTARDAGFEKLGMVGEMPQPSFLALHPNRRFLYAVSELGNNGEEVAAVYAFSIDHASGKLTFLNKQPSGGGGACHLVVDKTGKCLLVANYGTGSAAAFPVAEDGRIGERTAKVQFSGSGPNPHRQRGPHAHAVVLSKDERFVFVPDLGADKIRILKLDAAKGQISNNDPAFAEVKPGSGPRHFTFAPSGRHAYVLSEMGSLVTAFDYDSGRGALTKVQEISTLPDGFDGENNSAEIQIDGAGKFLYASNRGHDSISVFAVDRSSGKLRLVEIVPTGGHTPRNFAIDPRGRRLIAANQDSNNLVVFDRDENTGRLKNVGKVIDAPKPVCLVFVAA